MAGEREKFENGNGALDGEFSPNGKKFRAFVPENAWEFLWALTKMFGFPALMCLALMYYVWSMGETSREAAAQAHTEFQKSMAEQTAAIREGTAEQRKMTEAIIELKVRTEAHMRAEEHR